MFTKALILAYIAATTLAQQDFLSFQKVEPRKLEDLNRQLRAKPTGPLDDGWFQMNDVYTVKSRQDKLDDIWTMLQIDESNNEEPQDFFWSEQPRFFTDNAQRTFCARSDEMPRRRIKTTHTQGVVAKVSWVPIENEGGYTGVFRTGSEEIVMRLSDSINQTKLTEGLMPSLAMKFLYDGRDSENIMAMPSFEASDSWDFFEKPFRNRVKPFDAVNDPIDVMTIQKKLVEGNKHPFAQAISGIANKELDGTLLEREDVKIPYELEFRGRRHFGDDKVEGVEWYEQMKEFEAGDTVFDVWALVAPETFFGFHIKIAEIKLQTPLYTSKAGDNRLFFKHTRIQNDMKYWHWCWRNLKEDVAFDTLDPEQIWGNEVPADYWPMENQEEAKELYTDQMEKYGCPFAWLLELH